MTPTVHRSTRRRSVKKTERAFRLEERFLAPGAQSISINSRLVIDHAKGVYLTDLDGNTYLDFFSGVTVGSLGHCHPRYVAALSEQLRKVTFGSFTTLNRIAFLRTLAAIAPGTLKRTQLYSGGAEAVEAALRLAKAYTRRFEVVGFWGGFHGKTGGVLGLVGDRFKHEHGPMAPGLHLAPYANCYRCAFQANFPECGFLCVEFLRKIIRHNTTGSIAAILVEPVQGTSGNVSPPPGYLRELANVAKDCAALLIADEMITGFGRTGTMFGVDHDGVVPDIMTLGKGMGGGFPVSALISSDEILSAKPFSLPSASSSSYGGNPLAAAAARVTLETIISERLVENSRKVGSWLLEHLAPCQEAYPFVGHVRGKGLMIGVELVRDKKSKQPLSSRACQWIFQEGLDAGIVLMISASALRINPALVISQSEAEKGFDILNAIFRKIEKNRIHTS